MEPGNISGRNLVIASVQSGSYNAPDYQSGDTFPDSRPNGGDLVSGDFYYDTIQNVLYVWTGEYWSAIGGSGMFEEIHERLNKFESYFSDGILDAGNAYTGAEEDD
jgi:hypothetical protein